jgi:ankyrin repeat protein
MPNYERVLSSIGYVYRGHCIDEDWSEKARNLGVVSKGRDPARLQSLERSDLIRGYTEYKSGGGTALIRCIRSFQYGVGLHEIPNLLEMVRILLRNGANPFENSRRVRGGVLHAATQIGDFELIHIILLSTFGDMESVKAWEPYPFETVNVLPKTEIDVTKNNFVNQRDEWGQTPLHTAIDFLRSRAHLPTEIIEFLIDNGADVNARDNEGRTALFSCPVDRFSGITNILFEHGADVNAVNKYGESFLFEHNLTPQAIEQHLHHGADINIENRYGETPLHAAVQGHLNVQFLISVGAEIEAIDNRGQTPIFIAVIHERFDSFMTLFDAGANLSTVSENGETLLHLAVRNKNITQFLINHDADVNARDNLGQTPILNVAQRGDAEIGMLLWKAGADIYSEDNLGESAFKIGTFWDPKNPIRIVIAAEIAAENDRKRMEAFAMSHHTRLGEGSWAHLLYPDITRKIQDKGR